MMSASPNPTAPALPKSIEAEQALLGAILINNDAFRLAAEHVEPDQFYEGVHRVLFEVCGDLIRAGKPANPVTLMPYILDQDLGGLTTGQYIARLASEATTIVNAPDYAKTIADMASRRALIGHANDLIAQASEPRPNVSAVSILEEYEGAVADLRVRMEMTESGSMSLERCVDRLVKSIVDKRQGKEEKTSTTGFLDIDRAIGGGWRPGHLYMFGGRPGMGKTTFLTASARKTARKGNGVGILSLEIDPEQSAARFVASAMDKSIAPMTYSDILTGTIPEERDQEIEDMRRYFADYPIEIDCTSGLGIGAIESRARSMQAKLKRKGFELKVLYVDYLGLIDLGARIKGDSKASALGELVLALRNLARRLGIAIVLFAQLNRDVEKRDDKRPNKEDFRDSGNIEEHADVIALLYRPAAYDEPIQQLLDRGVHIKVSDTFITDSFNRRFDLEVILDKNRFGPRCSPILHCEIARALIDDARRTPEPQAAHYGEFDL